jgi:predicted  nucleic acid-binding Zn-ribbon protein
VVQLRALSAVRAGQKNKTINIDIPNMDVFIHRTYIAAARILYKSIYLYDASVAPLVRMQNNNEIERIVREAILGTVRDHIPIENLLRSFLDPDVEEDITEEIKEEIIPPPPPPTSSLQSSFSFSSQPSASSSSSSSSSSSPSTFDSSFPSSSSSDAAPRGLTFNDIDEAVSTEGNKVTIDAPKTIDRLEEIGAIRNQKRKQEDMDNSSDEDDQPTSIVFAEDGESTLTFDDLFKQEDLLSDTTQSTAIKPIIVEDELPDVLAAFRE